MLKTDNKEPLIIVIGIDDVGVSSVNHMVAQGLQGVQLVGIDIDAQPTTHNLAPIQMHIGIETADGLRGSNINSEVQSAVDAFHINIKTLVGNAKIVFITTEVGEISGTYIAPAIAKIARDLNILTVAVVTKPFSQKYEYLQLVDEDIKTLYKQVDGMIVIPNTKSIEVIRNYAATQEYFATANNLVHRAVVGITGNIFGMSNTNCSVCIDIEDVCSMLSDAGIVMMGEGLASGQDRARCATVQAVQSILMAHWDSASVCSLLIILNSSSSFTMGEYKEVMKCLNLATKAENWGVAQTFDDTMGDELRVTVFATGLKRAL